ncbi:glutathione S-transferase family protein [Rhodopila sp.]|jgi:glutathione S-transferase|uniref:glutathione S-transferase family protein n=1 Tax=Rhodopila sp. TaxID=2480087 RepID=UPI002C2C358C|nr:glutathione S-transferase family protein [Rhodopila sp.]HVZ09967.1 glutathione S-transferase family protein [Rhodopila sp.]
MILIGQYDSPFVRRVAIALRLYHVHYEHWPWSTFGDADKLAVYNPLRRVPTLLLDDGEVLIESAAILDYLDERAGDHRLIAAAGQQRRAALKVCGLATGLCDKMVSLVYEQLLHAATSDMWIARCRSQIGDVLDALQADRAQQATPFWFGNSPGHADIAVGCAMRFLADAHPDIHAPGQWPALAAHAARCEALPAFQAVVQPFIPPTR